MKNKNAQYLDLPYLMFAYEGTPSTCQKCRLQPNEKQRIVRIYTIKNYIVVRYKNLNWLQL